jgi:phage-related protein
MEENFLREIYYCEHHYLDFFEKLRPEVKKKFNWTLQLIATIDRVPKKYFDYMTNSTGIFELRVEVGSDIFRVFSFFDKGNLVVLINGFQKKTQKTPKIELELAEKLKKQYFDEQQNIK